MYGAPAAVAATPDVLCKLCDMLDNAIISQRSVNRQNKKNIFKNIDFSQHAFNVLGCHCPDFSYLETSSSVEVLCLAQGHSGLCLCASLNGLEDILQECEAEVQVHYLQW